MARGRIQLLPDGTIDPVQADAAWPQRPPCRAGSFVRTPDEHAAPDGLGVGADPKFGTLPLSQPFDPRALDRARAAKTSIDAQRAALELRVREGQLLERTVVVTEVFDFARSWRQTLHAWPSRIGPELAAELGVDPVVLAAALEAHLRDELAQRSLRLPDPLAAAAS